MSLLANIELLNVNTGLIHKDILFKRRYRTIKFKLITAVVILGGL